MTQSTPAPCCRSGAPRTVEGFKAVPVAVLKASESVSLRLYLMGADGKTPFLYRDEGLAVTPEDFERLERKGIRWLYVNPGEHERLRRQVDRDLPEIMRSEELPPAARLELLQFAVEEEVNHAFAQINVQAAVAESKRVASHLVSVISSKQTAPQSLFRIMRHDWYTFTHMINVSAYGVMLARKLGIRDRDELEEIAMGGMIHDVGKRFIPPTILNKPGRLTDEEMEVVRQHPQRGFEELSGHEDVSWAQLMMVYQHHERLDGGGYPVGATAEDIHPWACLCAVVDVFDALTSMRPYRKPQPLPAVLTYFDDLAGTHLDEEMARCWAAMMREQPEAAAHGLAAS